MMIDLFAGAGGLSEGLREAGFKSLYANELVATYAQTFGPTTPDTLVDSSDIRSVDAAGIRERLRIDGESLLSSLAARRAKASASTRRRGAPRTAETTCFGSTCDLWKNSSPARCLSKTCPVSCLSRGARVLRQSWAASALLATQRMYRYSMHPFSGFRKRVGERLF